jgi:hypothetical protein
VHAGSLQVSHRRRVTRFVTRTRINRTESNLEWTEALFEAMRLHLEVSVYVNNPGAEGQGRIRAAYGDNYPRLTALKTILDPDNLFRVNQNIEPS